MATWTKRAGVQMNTSQVGGFYEFLPTGYNGTTQFPCLIFMHGSGERGNGNSQLDSMLRARGIRTLIFVGIASNVCVESTLRDAFHLEYFAVMLSDATHHLGPDFIQQATLYNVETFFGWVSTVADFCGSLGQPGQEISDAV